MPTPKKIYLLFHQPEGQKKLLVGVIQDETYAYWLETYYKEYAPDLNATIEPSEELFEDASKRLRRPRISSAKPR